MYHRSFYAKLNQIILFFTRDYSLNSLQIRKRAITMFHAQYTSAPYNLYLALIYFTKRRKREFYTAKAHTHSNSPSKNMFFYEMIYCVATSAHWNLSLSPTKNFQWISVNNFTTAILKLSTMWRIKYLFYDFILEKNNTT